MTQSSVKQHNIGFLLVRTHFKTNMAEYKIEYYVLSEYGSDSVKKYTTIALFIKLVKFGLYYHKRISAHRLLLLRLMLARLQQVTTVTTVTFF